MKLDPINLIGGFYQDDNLPWSAQDTVNWIPRPAEMPGTISQMKLVGAPGLSFLADIDDDPVRIGGFRNVEGRMFIVAGTTLYELNTDLTTTVRGTIPGAGPVTMAHNQLEFGNELCIGNGSGTLYVWNTFTNTFTTVTDDAATGSVQSVYLNRRIIHLDPFGRFGYPSEIDSATSYDSLDRFDSEASPDKFVGLGVSQFELVGISQRTTEFYSDTGATEQPFRPKRIAINRGCAARNSIVQLGGTLAMLGDDGIFYRLQGYQWEPISTGPVNKAIEGNNWANCFGFVYEDRKHEIAYWTFPDGQTWGYDAWTGLMHRRESFGFNRWRINAIEKWNDMWIAGDFQSGIIYQINWNAFSEAGKPLISTRTAPPIYNNGNTVLCPMIDLVFDTGRGEDEAVAIPPVVVSGDIGDGFVGQTGTYQYTGSGGLGELTFAITSGSLPPGATMSVSGLVTFNYSTIGSYSWTVTATDIAGNTGSLNDSNQISTPTNNILEITNYVGDGSNNMRVGSMNVTGGGFSVVVRRTGSQGALTGAVSTGSVSQMVNYADGSTAAGSVTFDFGVVYGSPTGVNEAGVSYTQYLFKKVPGFVDVVQYTGTGVAHTVPHSLAATVGLVTVFSSVSTDTASWDQQSGPGFRTPFGSQSISTTSDTTAWNNTSPTSAVFSVGTSTRTNANGRTYLALLIGEGSVSGGVRSDLSIYSGNGLTISGPTISPGFLPDVIFILPNNRNGTTRVPTVMDSTNSGPWTGSEILYNFGAQGTPLSGNLVNVSGSSLQVTTADARMNENGQGYRALAFRRTP